MLELARNYGGSPVLLGTIAERQDISPKYLHAMLTSLRAAGLVRSVRGAGGGYALTRPPNEIKLDDVFRTLEGSLELVDCVENESLCDRSSYCAVRDLWSDMGRSIEGVLSKLTLEELLSRQKTKEDMPSMYYI